tara:strand:- start:298 stop:492 length:195 start_codon:yes stop_codon:yes gene_type:complete
MVNAGIFKLHIFRFLLGGFGPQWCESKYLPISDGKNGVTDEERYTLQQLLPDFTESFTEQFATA